jgi:hypothetical protein
MLDAVYPSWPDGIQSVDKPDALISAAKVAQSRRALRPLTNSWSFEESAAVRLILKAAVASGSGEPRCGQ